MKLSKEHIVILVLCGICLILGFIAFHKEQIAIDQDFLHARIDSLTCENKSLLSKIDGRDSENNKLKAINDSIVSVNDSLSKKRASISTSIHNYDNFKSPHYKSSADSMRKLLSENGIN